MYETEASSKLAHKCTSLLPAAAAATVREADDKPCYVPVQRLHSESSVWHVGDVKPATSG